MRDYQKIIQDDIKWLFYHYELDEINIKKSVAFDRKWDYILKLRMDKPKNIFKGVIMDEDGTVDCVPPWSLTELLKVIQSSGGQA